jgi:hypothetical protein
MASFSCERAADFCRQLSTSKFLSRASRSRATFFTSARSAVSAPARARQDVEDDQFLLAHVLAHVALLLVVRLLDSFSSSSNSCSMLRLPAL